MNKIVAASYSEDLLSMPLRGKIHSIFKRSINVLSHEKKMYTICQEDIFNGPRQIKLANQAFKQLMVEKGMLTEFSNHIIYLGKQEISIKESIIYGLTKLTFPLFLPVTTKDLLFKVEQKLTNQLDTVGFFRKTIENDVEQTMWTLLKKYSDILIEGMILESKEMIEDSVRHLIGLGHGLTPSGDDFLTGVSLVINSFNYPFCQTKQYVNQMIITYQNQTNSVSRNELILSIEGKNLEPVINFIEAIYQGNSFANIEANISDLLMIGSSSGSDIAAGILGAFKATIAKLNEFERP